MANDFEYRGGKMMTNCEESYIVDHRRVFNEGGAISAPDGSKSKVRDKRK